MFTRMHPLIINTLTTHTDIYINMRLLICNTNHTGKHENKDLNITFIYYFRQQNMDISTLRHIIKELDAI